MKFPTPLVPARLVRRYKRFLADVVLHDGSEATAHCPNPGSMMGLAEPGMRVWLMPAGPDKKLAWSWKLVELPNDAWVGVDTSVPNRVVKEALMARALPELAGYGTVRPEVRYGTASRIDFLLSEPGRPDAYVEVKNVHLRRHDDWAEFPDCVTTRGAKHLAELSQMRREGHRSIMLYLVQRTDCTRFRLATDLDPGYTRAFGAARDAGVEMLCYGTSISPQSVSIGPPVPVAVDM